MALVGLHLLILVVSGLLHSGVGKLLLLIAFAFVYVVNVKCSRTIELICSIALGIKTTHN